MTSAAAPSGPIIEFYFDFISPFGYFASLRIDELATRQGYETDWHSMLLGVSVLKVMNLPPISEIPLKGDYIRHDAKRYCRRHRVQLGRRLGDPPSNPVTAGRSFHWAKHHAPDRAGPLARAIFAAYGIVAERRPEA